MRLLQIVIDTAGVRHVSEFEPGCTAAVRNWTEYERDWQRQLAEQDMSDWSRLLRAEDEA